jgi:hypothetical protein
MTTNFAEWIMTMEGVTAISTASRGNLGGTYVSP